MALKGDKKRRVRMMLESDNPANVKLAEIMLKSAGYKDHDIQEWKRRLDAKKFKPAPGWRRLSNDGHFEGLTRILHPYSSLLFDELLKEEAKKFLVKELPSSEG